VLALLLFAMRTSRRTRKSSPDHSDDLLDRRVAV